MNINGQPTRSIWAQPDGSIGIIDQTRLPQQVVTATLASATQVIDAIRAMRVRGAPLIGVTGAYGLALALRADATDAALDAAHHALNAARPTAVNLRWALDRVRRVAEALRPDQRAAAAWAEAGRIAEEDVAINRDIGRHGAELLTALHRKLGRPVQVLTHCNAGWIATVDYGTALSAIYQAHDSGVPLQVWVDETRPRNQGLLTAWELAAHGVPHTLIVDNAGGHLMQHGEVDIVIVGADRVTARGDVCNKIGTYPKALAAHDNHVPFYAAVPSPTIDWQVTDALRDIPIEDRDGDEVRIIAGRGADGEPANLRLADATTAVANPAFDITPARLVTGIITERGVVTPDGLRAQFGAPTARGAAAGADTGAASMGAHGAVR